MEKLPDSLKKFEQFLGDKQFLLGNKVSTREEEFCFGNSKNKHRKVEMFELNFEDIGVNILFVFSIYVWM